MTAHDRALARFVYELESYLDSLHASGYSHGAALAEAMVEYEDLFSSLIEEEFEIDAVERWNSEGGPGY